MTLWIVTIAIVVVVLLLVAIADTPDDPEIL